MFDSQTGVHEGYMYVISYTFLIIYIDWAMKNKKKNIFMRHQLGNITFISLKNLKFASYIALFSDSQH